MRWERREKKDKKNDRRCRAEMLEWILRMVKTRRDRAEAVKLRHGLSGFVDKR